MLGEITGKQLEKSSFTGWAQSIWNSVKVLSKEWNDGIYVSMEDKSEEVELPLRYLSETDAKGIERKCCNQDTF